jgi:hypothetical protein
MNRFLILSLALLGGCGSPQRDFHSTSRPAIFYVATNGNDGWSGRQPAPNWRKTDGPFASVPGALKVIRESQRNDRTAGRQRVTVFIRGGSYFLREPLVLKPADSGLTLAAYHGEVPVISGGRRIGGWKAREVFVSTMSTVYNVGKAEKKEASESGPAKTLQPQATVAGKSLWVAEVPEARGGKWPFRELWVNGTRAVRARHPDTGYLSIEGLLDATPSWDQGHTRFRFRPGDLKSSDSITNAEVVAMTRWVESRLPVLSLDDHERIVTFSKRSVFELTPGDLYYVEGAFEFLDKPGEWYLDSQVGRLYYLPRPGEKLNQIEAIAPVFAQVVRFEGNPNRAEFVEGVTFRGVTFSHTEWYFPEGFHTGKNKPNVSPEPKAEIGGFAQAAIGVPGAVWGEGIRECIFEDCRFSNLGNYGVELACGCKSNRISHCEFSDLGAGGVKIGETHIREMAPELTEANEITDCHIHDGGKMFHSAEGIWVGESPDNRITHNHIHDFYYTGISLGWTWGYGKSLTTNNAIEFNHVHHIGVKSDGDGPILSDMGGIYTLGLEFGTVIRNNIWHDIAGLRYGGWGIYFDEGSSGILAENNLVYRTTHGGFHEHYGATNRVFNNIFALGRDGQLQRTRPEPHLSFSFETNIVYFDSGNLLKGDWSGDKFQMDWNLYFDARPGAKPESFALGQGSLEQWRERGNDRNSIVADPLFVAPQQSDFRLQSNSPAFKLGFKDIDLRTVGVREGAR